MVKTLPLPLLISLIGWAGGGPIFAKRHLEPLKAGVKPRTAQSYARRFLSNRASDLLLRHVSDRSGCVDATERTGHDFADSVPNTRSSRRLGNYRSLPLGRRHLGNGDAGAVLSHQPVHATHFARSGRRPNGQLLGGHFPVSPLLNQLDRFRVARDSAGIEAGRRREPKELGAHPGA